MNLKSTFVRGAAVGLLLLSSWVQAGSYTALDLGRLDGLRMRAMGLNASGQVVGISVGNVDPVDAFITNANGAGLRALDELPSYLNYASGINDVGQVTGYAVVDSTRRAFITGPNGTGVTYIGPDQTYARAISATGRVVGFTNPASGGFHAFTTGDNGTGFIDLTPEAGTLSLATAVNSAGQVVGTWRPGDGDARAFLTGANGEGGLRDLGTLGGLYSRALGINDSAQVVGWAFTSGNAQHAFVTDAGGANMRDLGTLGGNESAANAINAFGTAVGYSLLANGESHAFISFAGMAGMTDLNNWVSLPAGVYLTEAVGINVAGQIVANGSDGAAYLLTPVPEPASWALMGMGIVALLRVKRRRA